MLRYLYPALKGNYLPLYSLAPCSWQENLRSKEQTKIKKIKSPRLPFTQDVCIVRTCTSRIRRRRGASHEHPARFQNAAGPVRRASFERSDGERSVERLTAADQRIRARRRGMRSRIKSKGNPSDKD